MQVGWVKIGDFPQITEQFPHCGLTKFRHSKSSVYRWYTQLDRRRFVYDTWDNGSRLGRVMVECTLSTTHCLRLYLQLHTIDLVRTCCISNFCTVAWQLARFQLTRRIARSLGDSWASCQYKKVKEFFLHNTISSICHAHSLLLHIGLPVQSTEIAESNIILGLSLWLSQVQA